MPIQVTVLSEGDEAYSPASLADVERDITYGDAIGSFTTVEDRLLEAAEVRPILQSLSNDGTFFDPTDDWLDPDTRAG